MNATIFSEAEKGEERCLKHIVGVRNEKATNDEEVLGGEKSVLENKIRKHGRTRTHNQSNIGI